MSSFRGRSGVSTKLLYLTDSYARAFEARVTGVDPDARAVMLDRSAFYPAGGGQPADTGTVHTGTGALPVNSVKKQGGEVFHILSEYTQLPATGEAVHGVIDWDRRYRLMRTHTALHVLCGVVFRDFGALVTGGNMDIDKARMDFELEDLSPDRVSAIEQAANAEIDAGRDIRIQILPREEAFQIPDLIRTKINLLPEGITEVRTVEIVGLDLQADGGTHVANTREVGGIEVIGTRSKGRINKRLEIVLLDRPHTSDTEDQLRD
jgi:misacylated tRNA(Ala) deacylase